MDRKVVAYYPLLNRGVTLRSSASKGAGSFKSIKYANPHLKIDDEYEDAYLGRGKNSPLFRLSMLMEECKQGKVGLILVYSCKYFTRNSEEALATVQELLALPEPVGVYFEYENIYTLEDPNQEKLKEALKFWDYEQHLSKRKRMLVSRMANNKPITGEGMILEIEKGSV